MTDRTHLVEVGLTFQNVDALTEEIVNLSSWGVAPLAIPGVDAEGRSFSYFLYEEKVEVASEVKSFLEEGNFVFPVFITSLRGTGLRLDF